MKVFIQKKPRGKDEPWKTILRINKGNRGVKIARELAEKIRKLDSKYVIRIVFNRFFFPPKNCRFVSEEQRNLMMEKCKKKSLDKSK